MDNLYGDERISSYLDGELSADEQARFEERLAESAELRQLVEELRALRGSLDLLPRYQLEPDFAERMLRRAEQRMLIGGDGGSSGGALRASASGESNAPPQTQPASAELAQPSHAVRDESRRFRRRIVRPLIYASAAIAAAILIMVFTPPGGNEVTQNRSAEKPVQRGDGPVSSTSKDERALSGLAVERSKTPAQKNPASPQVASQSNGVAKDGKPIPDARVNESLESDHSKLVEDAAAKQADRSLSPSDGSLAGNPATTSNKPADRDSLSQLRSTAAKADQTGKAARMDDAELANKPISSQTSDKQLSAEALGVARRGVEGNGGKSGLADGRQSDQGRHYSNANDLAKANEILRRHGYGTAPANLLVASYGVSPDTSNSAFLGLLAKHRIAMWPATDGAPPVSSQLMDQVSREAGARSEAWLEQGRPIQDDKTAANGRPTQTPQLGAILEGEEPRRDLEIVYVEGSLEQITELVSDLDASKTKFRSLAVDPTTVEKLQLLRKPDNAATPTDAMGDVHARGEAVPESKPMGLAIDDRVRKREPGGITAGGAVSNGTVANGNVANGVGAGGAAVNAAGAAGTAADRPSNANIYSYRPDSLAAPATANRVPREEKNGPSIAKSEAGKELHGLRERQAEAKDAASQPGNKVQTADKSAPADSNAPAAKGGEAETLTQPAAGFGAAKAGSDDRNKAVPFHAQTTKDPSGSYQNNDASDLAKRQAGEMTPNVPLQSRSMTERGGADNKPAAVPIPSAPETPPAFSALGTTVRAPGAAPPTAAQAAPDSAKSPAGRENRDGDKPVSEERSLELGMNPSRPKQADRGKREEGESFGYAFWLYPLPTEAKQELNKEQLDRFKFQKQQVEDASPASTALGSVAAAKSPPPGPSAPPSAPAVAPTARPMLAEPTQPSPIQLAPTNKATTRPEDPSAPKSAKEPAAEAGGRPEADKPAIEKQPESGGVNAKLRDESNDFQPPPAAMPPSPPTPKDFERSLNREAPRAGTQVVAKADAKAGGAAAPSPRIQAILIFRIDPPPTSAAPPPAAGPASDVKAKQ